MFKKELKIGKILDTFETALRELDELQIQEDGKEAEAMDEINKQQALMEEARVVKTRAGNVATNLRALISTEASV